jgi:hypothetical protein
MAHFTASALKAGILSGNKRAIIAAKRAGLSGNKQQMIAQLEMILANT